eukprot:scaffold116053_cov19-Prasinocladus_malaysianus.AAC.1
MASRLFRVIYGYHQPYSIAHVTPTRLRLCCTDSYRPHYQCKFCSGAAPKTKSAKNDGLSILLRPARKLRFRAANWLSHLA